MPVDGWKLAQRRSPEKDYSPILEKEIAPKIE